MIKRLWLFAVTTAWPAWALAQSAGMGRADGNATDGYGPMSGYGHMDQYGHMMNFWGGHIVTWIILFVAVGALIYFITRAAQAQGPAPPSHETPLDVLKKRYARGDISKEQFEQMKKDL